MSSKFGNIEVTKCNVVGKFKPIAMDAYKDPDSYTSDITKMEKVPLDEPGVTMAEIKYKNGVGGIGFARVYGEMAEVIDSKMNKENVPSLNLSDALVIDNDEVKIPDFAKANLYGTSIGAGSRYGKYDVLDKDANEAVKNLPAVSADVVLVAVFEEFGSDNLMEKLDELRESRRGFDRLAVIDSSEAGLTKNYAKALGIPCDVIEPDRRASKDIDSDVVNEYISTKYNPHNKITLIATSDIKVDPKLMDKLASDSLVMGVSDNMSKESVSNDYSFEEHEHYAPRPRPAAKTKSSEPEFDF